MKLQESENAVLPTLTSERKIAIASDYHTKKITEQRKELETMEKEFD